MSLRDVWRAYGAASFASDRTDERAPGGVDVLRGVSCSIAVGEVVAVVGPSGSGKSTLLNIAGLLDVPDRGSVVFCASGSESTVIDAGTPHSVLQKLRRSAVGFVFQHFHLMSSLTVLHNAALPALLNSQPDAFERAKELLMQVGLQDRLDFYPAQLSGGEMQRCAIARALIHRPALIVADEPTGSLDQRSGLMVLKLLKEVSTAGGAALLIATHSVEAAKQASRVIELGALSSALSANAQENKSGTHE